MRLFLAVWPPPAVMDSLERLAKPEVPGVRWSRPDQWHVTLHFIGSVSAGHWSEVEERFRSLDLGEGLRPGRIQAVMGPATQRLSEGILMVPVAGIDALAARVARSFGSFSERSFVGHVTVARARGPGAAAALRTLEGTPVSEKWVVDEVTLVESHTHHEGARYVVIERRSVGAGRVN